VKDDQVGTNSMYIAKPSVFLWKGVR